MWLLHDLDLFIAPRHNRGNTSCSSPRQTAATSRRHTAANLAKPNTPDSSHVHIDSVHVLCYFNRQLHNLKVEWLLIVGCQVSFYITVYSLLSRNSTQAKLKKYCLLFIKNTTSTSIASASISDKTNKQLHVWIMYYDFNFIIVFYSNAIWILDAGRSLILQTYYQFSSFLLNYVMMHESHQSNGQ